jgi:hypothetical protein
MESLLTKLSFFELFFLFIVTTQKEEIDKFEYNSSEIYRILKEEPINITIDFNH